ncbi:hypothetical protein VNO77_00983 [Canavalia gladiata]|uniref:Uncharacterized protein n=1 Tax=Canavalia gladiata TaxID=3824 RepID=A0AAN9MQN0_CANGL
MVTVLFASICVSQFVAIPCKRSFLSFFSPSSQSPALARTITIRSLGQSNHIAKRERERERNSQSEIPKLWKG